MTPGFGPRAARLFHTLLALLFAVAWVSLASQVRVLIGSRGLLPLGEFAGSLPPDISFADVPSFLRHGASDELLFLGCVAGTALAVLGSVGVAPRLLMAAGTLLYLSYVVVCRNFLSFQWDNLLLECGALSLLLSPRRPGRAAVFVLRVLLFKLYFESGIAKYQSYLGDWRDGTAMHYYYETAPLPAGLAWYAHHLPDWFHALESRGALGFELLVPPFIFLGRRGRLFALAVFTGFQLVNLLTANYGFFSHLALALSVVLLDEADVYRIERWARDTMHLEPVLRPFRAVRTFVARRVRLPSPKTDEGGTLRFLFRVGVATVSVAGYLLVSLHGALDAFGGADAETPSTASTLSARLAPFRVVNTYHLFGHITRERIEPTFETSDGARFVEQDLRYKPGDPSRRPPYVAPHQPRVDFLLWFYGLSYERGVPAYVRTLLARLCDDPDAVQGLFAAPLPRAPMAVRVSFYRYRFTSRDERAASGAWWTRELLPGARTVGCAATATR
ncbi:MAG TPA: lipase maturation factor family protein [Polyangiaceae bacterium]|nr:lipase maturation factor family protein [Polyangiaceae bacterium]